jgi:putative flippase GtrA
MPSRSLAFAVVGAIGLAFQLAALHLLVVCGVPVAAAAAMAVVVAILHNFAWHRCWTWRDRSGSWPAQLARFAGLNGVVSIAGNVALTSGLVASGVPLAAANLAAVAACGVANFLLADRAVFLAVAIALASALPADAAVLEARTVQSWNDYVRATESRIERDEPKPYRLRPGPEEWRRLRAGELTIAERRTTRADGTDIAIAGGAVHHWVARVYLPAVRLSTLLAELEAPTNRRWVPAEVKRMSVVPAGDGLRVRMRVERDSLVDVTYDVEHRVRYTRHSPDHATSRSVSVRIVQVDNPGTPSERALAEGNDLGFLWRLNAYWRYTQVDDGVLVECESLALSRSVPLVVRGLAGPLIDRVSRESLANTLRALRAGFRPALDGARAADRTRGN